MTHTGCTSQLWGSSNTGRLLLNLLLILLVSGFIGCGMSSDRAEATADGDFPVEDGDANADGEADNPGDYDADYLDNVDAADDTAEMESDSDYENPEESRENSLWFRISTGSSSQSQVVEVVNPLPDDLRIPVAKSFTVEGKVTYTKDSSILPISGRIIFEPTKPDNLPPRLRWDTITAQLRQDNGSYQVKLARGGYNVYILPDSDLYRLPPHIEYRGISVVDEPLVKNYHLQSESDYIQISGDLDYTNPNAPDAMNGLTIKATNKELGVESSSYNVPPSGTFYFAFPKLDRDEVVLDVEVTGRFMEETFIPARTFPGAIKLIRIPDENNPDAWSYDQEYYNPAGDQISNLRIDYNDIPTGRCKVTGSFWSSSDPTAVCSSESRSTCTPVTNAIISLTGSLPTGEFKRTISVSADNEGAVSFDMLPGFYSMLIMPGSDQLAATTLTSLDCTAINHDATPEDIFDASIEHTLRERIVVTGVAYSPTQEPLSGAEVYATYLPSNETGTTIMYNTLTGDFGEFMMRMDPGTYNVLMQPPPGMNSAWMVRLNQNLVESGNRDFVLPEGRLVEGTIIFASDGTPVPESSIEISVISTDGSAVQIAKGTADENGQFTLLVDPSFILD